MRHFAVRHEPAKVAASTTTQKGIASLSARVDGRRLVDSVVRHLRGVLREVSDARAEEEAARRFRLRTPRRQ